MYEWLELFFLLVIVIAIIAAPIWLIYDCFYGEWQYVPMVDAAPEPPRPQTYQVMPGDTIWSIYLELYEGCDWEEVRLKIGQANGLRNDTLYPYEIIKLPEVSR